MNLQSAVKNVTFDARKLIRAEARAKRNALRRAGNYVRTVARNSIKDPPESRKAARDERGKFRKLTDSEKDNLRRTSKPSTPGSPPYNRTGKLKNTAIGISTRITQWGSVVIGARRVFRSNTVDILEHGGTKKILTFQDLQSERRGWRKKEKLSPEQMVHVKQYYGNLKQKAKSLRRFKQIYIAARPFMNPALQKTLPKLEGFIQYEIDKQFF